MPISKPITSFCFQIEGESVCLPIQLAIRDRQSIGMTLKPDHLAVAWPRGADLSYLPTFLEKKRAWLMQAWQRMQNRQAQLSANIAFDQYRYLGKAYPIQESSTLKRSARLLDSGTLQFPVGIADWDKKAVVSRLLKQKAQTIFDERYQCFVPALALFPSKIGLSPAKKRWGSCTSKRSIRLNWRLVQAPVEVIDAVLAHELAHLKELNHSPAFWNEVKRLMPNYQQADVWLKQHGHSLFIWDA